MKSLSLFFGSIFGFLAVAMGAFGSHALKAKLDSYSLGVWNTAVQYQSIHALALLAVGLLVFSSTAFSSHAYAKWLPWIFSLGILLFSGSLFLLSLTGIRALGAITPIGGVLFLLGWSILAKISWDIR